MEIDELDNVHVFRFLHKLKSSGRDSDELSIGFHKINEAREPELTSSRITKRRYKKRI